MCLESPSPFKKEWVIDPIILGNDPICKGHLPKDTSFMFACRKFGAWEPWMKPPFVCWLIKHLAQLARDGFVHQYHHGARAAWKPCNCNLRDGRGCCHPLRHCAAWAKPAVFGSVSGLSQSAVFNFWCRLKAILNRGYPSSGSLKTSEPYGPLAEDLRECLHFHSAKPPPNMTPCETTRRNTGSRFSKGVHPVRPRVFE